MSRDDAFLGQGDPSNADPGIISVPTPAVGVRWTSQLHRNESVVQVTPAEVVQTFGGGGEDLDMQEYVAKTFGALQLKCYPGSDGITTQRHVRLLKALKDYSRQHKRSDEGRALVWMCTTVDWCGGLADRMKGITYSLLLALFSRRRLLLTWNTAEQKFLSYNAVNWSTKSHNVQEYGMPLSLYSITQGYGIDKEPSLAKKIIEYIGGPHKVVYFSTNLEPSSLVDINKSFGLQWIYRGLQAVGLSNYTGKELDELVGLVFRYLFALDQQLIKELRAAKRLLGIEGVKYIGVHVRTGFVGTRDEETSGHPKLLHHSSQWQAVLDCAVAMADSHLGNGSNIFLASDSLLVKRMALLQFGSRVKFQDTLLGHLDSLSKKPLDDKGEESERIVQGMWVDLLMLAESYVLVTTDSGFGALAGFICHLPRHRTVHGLSCHSQ